ncbi:MAG: Cys-tRNA(Pro) deacylase [Lachnospiraceae bacterium]|nr:Cys-tRNA(Pro) deacylase [Lachnospiraceae bacterium]
MKKIEKTNVMRLLEQKKIDYKSYDFTDTGVISGVDVAKALGQNPNQVYKTLVTQGATKNYYVFLVPVEKELNLKAGAKAVGEKSIAMIKSKELLPLTGYIHGGCSPIGMKKQFKTVVDSSVSQFETIFFSAGKIGYQVEVAVKDIEKIVRYELGEIAE